MINLASLMLLSFAEVVFSPISKIQTSPSAITRTKEIGLWYNVLFSWPVFIVCFWINVSAATHLLRPVYNPGRVVNTE
jgi:etoposide-induced 2.4 mRNA